MSNRGKFSKDFHEETGYHFRPWRWAFGVLAVLVGLWVVLGLLDVVSMPFRSAHGVAQRVTNPDHVIWSYEHFHDSCASVRALDMQSALATQEAKHYAAQVKDQPDPLGQKANEVARLQQVATGIQQQRISVAEQYNADSRKFTESPFKGHSLPYRIAPDTTPTCEDNQ